MMNHIKLSAIIIILLGLSGCNGPDGSFTVLKPATFNMVAPDGPKNYRQGWKDGCETGLSSTNNSVLLTIGVHEFTIDKSKMSDRLYNKAWRYGFNHCGYSMKSLAQYNF